MAVRTVAASAANAIDRPESFLWQLASIVNQLINFRALGPANFEISTNMDIQNGDALDYVNGGVFKTLATDQVFDTGTTKSITADRWASALLSVNASGVGVVTWCASDYASEALAIAALPALPANNTPMGYVTVLTNSGNAWLAGTDALQGGTGGDVSADTNYVNGPVNDTIATRELGTP